MLRKDQPRVNALAEILLSYLAENSVDLALRKHLAVTLQYILTNDREFIIRNIMTSQYLQMLSKTKEQADGEINFELLGMCAQIILASAAHITK